MTGYVSSLAKRPPTLTVEEQKRLLKVTAKHKDTYRDHMIFSLALGGALREHELAALNVGDIADRKKNDEGRQVWRVRRKIRLTTFKKAKKTNRKKDNGNGAAEFQELRLPEATAEKLRSFLHWKQEFNEDLDPDAPLLCTERPRGRRLSTRTIRHLFRKWQEFAGFDQYYKFHDLRHTSITNVYKATKDIRVAQMHARHARIETTTIYTHVSDEDYGQAIKDLLA